MPEDKKHGNKKLDSSVRMFAGGPVVRTSQGGNSHPEEKEKPETKSHDPAHFSGPAYKNPFPDIQCGWEGCSATARPNAQNQPAKAGWMHNAVLGWLCEDCDEKHGPEIYKKERAKRTTEIRPGLFMTVSGYDPENGRDTKDPYLGSEGSHRMIAGLQDPQDSDEGLAEEDPSIDHPVVCFEQDLDAAVFAGQFLAKQGYAECPGEPSLWMVNKEKMASWVSNLHGACQDLQNPSMGRFDISGNLWELLHELPGGEGLSMEPLLQRKQGRDGAFKASNTLRRDLMDARRLAGGIEGNVQAEAAFNKLSEALDTLTALQTLLREGGNQ